jgi:lysophospholipase L1-like esterase
MRTVLILVLLLIIAACAQPVQEVKTPPPIAKSEPADATPFEEPPAPTIEKEPEPIIEPLKLELTVDKDTVEIDSKIKATCIASGGVLPYKLKWTLDSNELECKQNICQIDMDAIKVSELSCNVIDNRQETISDKLTITTTKKKVPISEIITFGDSLTYGHGLNDPEAEAWPSLLKKDFTGATLRNHAQSGSTSWTTMDQVLVENQTKNGDGKKLIYIWVGANDIPRMISKEQYEQNLRFIAQNSLEIKDSIVTLITIPDVSKLWIADKIESEVNTLLNQFGVQGQLEVKQLGKDIVTDYNNIIFKVGNDLNIPVIDMFEHMKGFDQSLVGTDEVHPNSKGHIKVKQIILKDLTMRHPTKDFT